MIIRKGKANLLLKTRVIVRRTQLSVFHMEYIHKTPTNKDWYIAKPAHNGITGNMHMFQFRQVSDQYRYLLVDHSYFTHLVFMIKIIARNSCQTNTLQGNWADHIFSFLRLSFFLYPVVLQIMHSALILSTVELIFFPAYGRATPFQINSRKNDDMEQNCTIMWTGNKY
jgi:hypothetical protein